MTPQHLPPPKKNTQVKEGGKESQGLSNLAATFTPPEKRAATAIGIRFFFLHHL